MIVVSNEDEVIQNYMLNKQEPFEPKEIMKKFGRGRDSIIGHIRILKTREKLFEQQVGSLKYYIGREKIKPGEIVKVGSYLKCQYRANDEVSKIMCDAGKCNYRKSYDGCRLYFIGFKKSE